MKHSRNIFEPESYRGNGIRTVSATAITTIILTVISVLASIYVIVNFEELTAKIAIWVADFLTSGFLILVMVIAVIYFVIRLRCKIHRHFWGW